MLSTHQIIICVQLYGLELSPQCPIVYLDRRCSNGAHTNHFSGHCNQIPAGSVLVHDSRGNSVHHGRKARTQECKAPCDHMGATVGKERGKERGGGEGREKKRGKGESEKERRGREGEEGGEEEGRGREGKREGRREKREMTEEEV